MMRSNGLISSENSPQGQEDVALLTVLLTGSEVLRYA